MSPVAPNKQADEPQRNISQCEPAVKARLHPLQDACLLIMLITTITILYQASLNSGTSPTIWKAATVAPSSRWVTEHIIHSSMMRHFNVYSILTDYQHGFRKAHSCKSQLIITVDDIALNLDDGLQTDLILLNLSKTFDKVPHLRLLHKL